MNIVNGVYIKILGFQVSEIRSYRLSDDGNQVHLIYK